MNLGYFYESDSFQEMRVGDHWVPLTKNILLASFCSVPPLPAAHVQKRNSNYFETRIFVKETDNSLHDYFKVFQSKVFTDSLKKKETNKNTK